MESMNVTAIAARLLAVSLACLLVVGVGCGGEDDSEPTPDDPAAEAPERPEADDPQDGETPDAADQGSQRVLEACRDIVERTPGISEEMRRDLIARCEEAASDDEEAARRAASAACDAIAAATVPGPLRGPAADACRRAIPGVNLL
jgi:hypothetical protein